VAAARGALEGPWGAMTGFERAALLRRLADVITENVERLAELEVNDSGKLLREMLGQARALGGWYLYYAGIADKIDGRQIPTPESRLPCLHAPRDGRGGGGDPLAGDARVSRDRDARSRNQISLVRA